MSQAAGRLSPTRLPVGYYLANFLTVLQDTQTRCGDLLKPEEREVLARFRGMSLGSQRLYVRLLTRKGPWFRADGLRYEEIGDPTPCLAELVQEGFCEGEAELEDLLPLLTRGDLLKVLADRTIHISRGIRREELLDQLLQEVEEAALLPLLQGELRPVKPRHSELWRRIFLMFFGNFEQDLATFVVADAGILRYEDYALDPGLRAFATRADVDYLLSLRDLREQLEAASSEAELEALTQAALGMEAHSGVRQQRRFQGLLNALGQSWEKRQNPKRALDCYVLSQRPPARERRTRILAAWGDLGGACALAMDLHEHPRDVGEERFARGFLERQRKKLPGLEPWLAAHPKPEALPDLRLILPRHPSGSVERAALEAARVEGWEGFFAENHLWRAIFGLALWQELFAPVPGAFLHRFQNGPLDLGTADFHPRRQALIEARLAELAACPSLADELLAVADRKWGVANAFLAWRHLERSQLAQVLARVDASVLLEVLRVMAQSPLAFDSGFPDLFLYRPHSRAWQVWEVKGPGDALRPEQAWWLHRLLALGCTARVAWVRYAPAGS